MNKYLLTSIVAGSLCVAATPINAGCCHGGGCRTYNSYYSEYYYPYPAPYPVGYHYYTAPGVNSPLGLVWWW